MKRTDLAYFAGIIDGEGSIGIHKHKGKDYKRGFTFELVMAVNTCDQWLAEALKMGFGGHVNYLGFKYKSTFKQSHAMWRWAIHTQQACACLKVLLPYLRLKKYPAEVAIKFADAKRFGNGKSDEQYALEEAQRILVHNSVRKGKPIS